VRYELKSNGLFIVFEGIDGSGKNAHIRLLTKRLTDKGYDVLVTAEPWISEEGKILREIAKSGDLEIPPEEEANLYLADRIKHVRKEILPALEAGKIVLCSRYYYSTMAYQGALGADPERIREENEAAVPTPDVVIMLKIDIDESQRRINKRKKELELRYENDIYLQKVSRILYSIEGDKIHYVSTDGTKEEVSKKIFKIILPYLPDFKA